MIYSVFGDESSDGKCEIVFAVAGLFGDDEQWSRCISKWIDITRGEEFHAAEWDTPEHRQQYIGLVHVLAQSNLIGWGCAMDVRNYERLFPRAVEQLPYYQCFSSVVEHFGHYVRFCIPPGTVEFTFDQNLETEYHASKLYHHMRTEQNWVDRDFVADKISFATRTTPNIQVADLWTRELMKDFENCIGPVRRPMRISFDVLRRTHRFGSEIYDTKFFEDMKQALESVYEPGRGAGEYEAWRAQRGVQDNTEIRMQYMFHLSRQRKSNGQVASS